jgi:hypothetical protein
VLKVLSDDTCNTHHTYGPLKALLLDAVRMWLYPDEHLHAAPQCEQSAAELHCLIRTQTKIGLRQLFNGRFCKQWGDVQGEHLNRIRQQLPSKHNLVRHGMWRLSHCCGICGTTCRCFGTKQPTVRVLPHKRSRKNWNSLRVWP